MQEIQWLREAEELAPELAALRRKIHRCPEVGNQEFQTAETIEACLHACGVETKRLTDTAVLGTLRGGRPGPAAALRADMDALPVTEETGVEYASVRPGVMHACGHDVHVTAALGAVMLLSRHRQELPGTVKFFFQPDEEENGGARRMIEAGCMHDPAVEAVFGAHVAPDLPLGTVGVRYGKFYAASDMFDVTVLGKSAHGAEPEKGISALSAGARMVGALQELPRRFPGERCVVSVGAFHAGTVRNVLPGSASFSGIIRTLGTDTRGKMKTYFYDCLENLARETGTRLDISFRSSYPGIVNDDAMTALVEGTARGLLGEARVLRIEHPTMTSEDFGYFADAATGAFYHLGVGGSAPLHNSRFLPDESVLPLGAALHAAVLTAYLSGHSASDSSQEKGKK